MSSPNPFPRTREHRIPGHHLAFVFLAALLLSSCSGGDGPTRPLDDDPPTPARVVVDPGTLLLAREGAAEQLRAVVYDASGAEIDAEVTWQSTAPGVLSVASDGVVTVGPVVGTAEITATAGPVSSEPVLGIGARGVSGLLTIPDSAIVSDPVPADANADPGPGWQYRIRTRGVSPQPGQLVVGTGDRPLAGRVVATSDQGAESELTVEFVPLADLFDDLTVDLEIPLVEMEQPAGAPSGQSHSRVLRAPALAAAEGETTFSLGRFSCKASGSVPDIDLPEPTLNVEQALSLVFSYDNRIQVYGIEGTIEANFNYRPVVKVVFEGKVGCETDLMTLTVPLGGFLSWFVGIQVPLGIGMELNGKLAVAEVGFDVDARVEATAHLGLTCPVAGGACTGLTTFGADRNFDFEFISPNPDEQFKLELGGLGFLYAKPSVGSRFSDRARWEFLAASAGLEQTVDLATAKAQAQDDAYASSFNLVGKVDVGPGKDLADALKKLGEWLGEELVPDLTLVEVRDTLARSPKGSFTIAPAVVAPGDSMTLGELATFRVELDPVTYLGLESVERVEFLRRRPAGGGADFTLESNRPACRSVPGGGGKTVFECQTDYLEEDIGDHEFHAFVHARLFGVPLPVPLEVTEDGGRPLKVRGATCTGVTYDPRIALQVDTVFPSGSASGGSYSYDLSSHQHGLIEGTLTATSQQDETDTRTFSLDATTGDYFCLQPEDTTLVGTDAMLRVRASGRVGTDPADNVRGASAATASLAITDRMLFGESFFAWDVFSQAGEGLETFDEEILVRVPLGTWFRLTGGVQLWASSNRGTSHKADGRLQYQFLTVEDSLGRALPLRLAESLSGTNYFLSQGASGPGG